ncbi:MAG: amidohydrolase family protein [Oscillibacter sp.]|nr:amidohydrolase family protein [Oscillibacter sp.]
MGVRGAGAQADASFLSTGFLKGSDFVTAILKGVLVSAPSLSKLEVHAPGYLVLEDGVISGVFDTLPQRYAGVPVEDFGNCLITQSFTDLHLHAPQYPMLGIGLDLPLLDWLNTHAFPTEARFADEGYAREQYRSLAAELIRNGTTRVCMFSSLHRQSTLILMEELEKAGVTGYVGKVNMDRNGGENLQETTEESMRETLRWLDQCGGFSRVKPILTPRFTPSCTDELLAFLGKLAAERNLPVQSHLSENTAELEWVRRLHPDCEQYWQTYAKYGLWNSRTAMAHCVWSDGRERAAMRRAGVTAVHCADSNLNLCSGVSPVRTLLNEGVKVALGSDIAGGDTLSMFDVIASTIRSSKVRRILDDWKTDFLTTAEGWYLGTSAGAAFFGAKPGFAVGEPLHALVLDDGKLPPLPSAEERLARFICRRQEGVLRAVWSAGRRAL